MGLLLTGISPRATRVLFDSEFHPSCLDASLKKETKKLRDLKDKKNINQRQWDLLFPRKPDVPKSDNFDVTLMITLLRNLTNLSEPQKGYDHLPSPTEITTASDLARIKYYRNYLAHLENSTVDNVIFTSAWEDTSQAIGRLGGQHMQKECDELKTKVLDQTNKEIILEIKHSQNEIEELKWLLKKTKEELLTRIDEVPPKHIQDWKKKNKMFVTTRASDYVIQCLQKNSCVSITAPPGVGKSFIARHAALVLQQEQYKIIPVYSPTDIRDYHQPGKRTCFIIDDICGNFIADRQQIENWKQQLPVINKIIADKHCKIIVCCRLQIYKDDKFKILSPFMSCECNLISDDLSLTAKEKTKMVDIYIGTKGKNLNKVEKHHDFFPLLCYLCHKKKDANVYDFFRNPFAIYENDLDNLSRNGKEGKHKVCSLALCVLFNNRLKEKWFQGKVTDEQRQILEDTCEACRLNRGTPKAVLKDALDTLDGTFIGKQNGVYSTIHDKLFDFIAFHFGKTMIECLIDHGNINLVNERFIWQKSHDDKKENIDFIIQIPDDYLDSYLKKLVEIWSAGRVVLVINNANLEVTIFRQRLLQYLRQMDKSQQLSLSNIKDEWKPGITPLILTCYQGYKDMVLWILDNEADVNQCDKVRTIDLFEAWLHKFSYILMSVHQWTNHVNLDDISCFTPLFLAVVLGRTNILQELLLKNANVDLCFNWGFSTFLSAQQNENNERLSMLMQGSPDKCILNGRCPLSVASMQGNVDIVRLLLEKHPTVDLRDNEGMTALFIACWKGHTTIVSMLLEKDSNVDLCNKYGNTPLIIASQEGQTDIVRLLLERNPNIDLCNCYGVNAQYVACYYGHTAIVIMLLEKHPNVDICNKYGRCCMHRRITTLEITTDTRSIERNFVAGRLNNCNIIEPSNACLEKRYTTFMSVSLNSLYVDSCHKYGRSSLHIPTENIASKENDIYSLLVNPNVDICNMNSVTALYIASYFGYSTIVSALLEKNSNVDLCSMNGCSPLYKACQCRHIDVVKLLLEKNPNVDQQDIHGFSPLLLASQNGFVDIVRLLLEANPDVNLCNKGGCSALLLSSQCGHTDIVMLLLEMSPSVDQCDSHGNSPLLFASQNGFTDIVRLLLQRNPNVDQCNIDGVSPLFIASHNGFTDIVRLLLEMNPNVDICDFKGVSPLFVASQKGFTDIVRLLLVKNPNVNVCTNDAGNPLLFSSRRGYTGIVRLLIEGNANVDQCDIIGNSPLLMASYNGFVDIVRMLLERSADVNLCNNEGCSPLLLASQYGHIDIVKLLLKRRPNVDLCNTHGVSPLLFPSQNGDTDIVSLLLEMNPNVDLCNHDGFSPLLLSCQNGHTDIVMLLLERNPNVDLCNHYGCSPLLKASLNGFTDVVRLLLEKGANVNLCANNGFSPLLAASQNGNTDIMRLLLERDPNVDQCNKGGCSPLLLASQNGYTDIIKLLLQRNSCVDLCNKDGCSPLLLASQSGHSDIVRLLLEKNPNIDLRNNDGINALFIACSTGDSSIVSMILEKNPNCDLCTKDGFTPLTYACSLNTLNMVQLLIKHKQDTNIQTNDGGNALFFSARNGNLEITQLLLENNAYCDICIYSKQRITDTFSNHPRKTLDQVKQLLFDSLAENESSNVKDHVKMKSVDYAFDVVAGSSPLHIACFIGWKHVVSCLLDYKANINLTKEDGTTPLFYASDLGHEDIVRLLLEKGADTDTCRQDGKSPLNIATDNGHQSVIMMIKKHKKD
ncbi:serine/threonine-protein phosphatase 6 regulatory ankyrin repeat subunit C-like [Mytilus trossulus]|uniref:serine/threonine-protein phosphatase 6 regulatory ankyrin repeat subunit C-like n=1 Tax=Mytilus trossulus TaxID=6551 RepID=UPI0030061830